MTRKKEELTPLVPGEYRIYVCGPTVYNYVHIGNARPVVVFDTLRRYLEYQGNRVLFVSNITDIDDKIIAKANEDVPVKVLGAVVQQPISIVCALAEKNIKDPREDPDRQDHRLLRHPLRRGGGGPDVGDCGRHAG